MTTPAGDETTEETTGEATDETTGDDETATEIDYAAIGLWDDGPCDEALDPLVIGLMTVFESPVLSLEDQALALEASAEAFNARGGANGACIEVHTCDDGGIIDQAVACVREIDDAGVVATVNDQGTAGQAEVSAAMAEAGIPRVASNVTQNDWGDQNAYPLDASGTGVTFLLPNALIQNDVIEIGLIRVDLAAASALVGLISDLYADDGATFPYDVPVPEGTTDYTQFILGAEDAGVGGVTLALGEQEAIQVVRAGQQLGHRPADRSELWGRSRTAPSPSSATSPSRWSSSGRSRRRRSIFPSTTALREDLAASGEESLQTENLKASPMRSWIGLYALLKMMRDAGMTEFTREGITAMLQQAKDVPMLDMFGGENWTPNLNHPGIFSAPAPTTGRCGDGIPRPRDPSRAATSSRARRSASTRSCAVHPFGGPRNPADRVEPGRPVREVVPAVLDHRTRSGGHLRALRAGCGAHLPRFGSGQLRAGGHRDVRGLHRVRRPRRRARLGDASRARRRGHRGRRSVARVPSVDPPRVAPRCADRSRHRDDRTPRSPPSRRREALRRGQPTGRLLSPQRSVRLGRHPGPGGADLPRHHHLGGDLRALGLDPVHARRAGDQRQRAERARRADARVVT